MRGLPSVSPSLLEKTVLVHVGLLVFSASWIYGGNIWWMRSVLSVLAGCGALLTLAAFLQSGEPGREARRKAWWLLPWLGFIALVAISSLNPSFFPVEIGGQTRLAYFGAAHAWLPSTVNPAVTLRELPFGADVYLSAFNLLLVGRSRRALRGLFIFGALNTIALAVFGTLQQLSSSGYYFGAATSPNIRFFATFIYYNHWGAFMILWLAVCAGLVFYQTLRHRARDFWHSPVPLASLGILVMAVSAPVSASRAATGMAGLVLMVVLVHALGRIAAHRRRVHRAVWPPVALLLLLAVTTLAAVGWLANRSIHERYTDTRLALEKNQSLLEGRLELYRDTWELARQKPLFGWGLASYGEAFQLIRPRPLAANRQYESAYVNAHNDWLQSVAETGFAGTALLLLMALLPALATPWRLLAHPLVGYPLLGCLIIALYAWIEFPFGNAAVLISCWVIYFATLRYARLQSRAQPGDT